MSEVVKVLQSSLHEQILLNEQVEKIDCKNEKTNFIKIKTRAGNSYTASVIICTFSLGVLKDWHLQLFSPPLPQKHQNVIDKIGFGAINKIFLHFDQKWWSDGWKGLQLLWDDDLSDVRSSFCLLF